MNTVVELLAMALVLARGLGVAPVVKAASRATSRVASSAALKVWEEHASQQQQQQQPNEPQKRAYSGVKNVAHIKPLSRPTNTVIRIVPQGEEIVVERFGQFQTILEAGFHVRLPWPLENLAYRVSRKLQTFEIDPFEGTTKDNVRLTVDGVFTARVVDTRKAVYEVQDYTVALLLEAQTLLREAIGKYTMDEINGDRAEINKWVCAAIDGKSKAWGLGDISIKLRRVEPPKQTAEAMALVADAERRKTAAITDSEGKMQAAINEADGKKKAAIFEADGRMQALVLEARGRAQAQTLAAQAQAQALTTVSTALENAEPAAMLALAEKQIAAWGNLAQKSTTLVLDNSVSDPHKMLAQFVSLYGKVNSRRLDD